MEKGNEIIEKVAFKVPSNAAFKIKVGDKVGYLKVIPMAIYEIALGYSMPTSGNPRYVTAGQVIINSCWVGGDEELKDNESAEFPAACIQACSVLGQFEGSMEKL